jgi:lysophospholipase L1-like esterase
MSHARRPGLLILAVIVCLLAAVAVTPSLAGAAPRTSGPVRIMPLGDSITYGEGSPTWSGYRRDLWKRLVQDAGYTIDFVGSQHTGALPDNDNEGHQGWRIDQIDASIDGWLATYHPNIVLLHIGTNDMNQNYQADTAPQRLGALIDKINTDAPDTTVLVASIVPATDATIQQRINKYNAAVPGVVAARAQAGKRVRHVDLTSLSPSDFADTLHPNDAGFAKMAALWYPAVARAIGDGRNLPLFGSGFEAGDTAQTWLDTTVGTENVGGYCCGLTAMEASPREELARGGVRAFMYSGWDNSTTRSYAYAKVFDVHIPVSPQTVLSYWVLPQLTNSTYVAVDLLFTDGSDLRDSAATDQFGVKMHPNQQGLSGHLALNTWNQVRSVVGAVAAGKIIDEIRIGYDQPAATGAFRGYVDDVAFTDELTPYVGDNLALKRPVTAAGPTCSPVESADRLTDGVVSGNSKWCTGATALSAEIDLGTNRRISRIVVRHAGAGGEPVVYNTKNFAVTVSVDAGTWTSVANIIGNTDSVTTHPVNGVPARYIRLDVIEGTQNGENCARIYEIEVYGT